MTFEKGKGNLKYLHIFRSLAEIISKKSIKINKKAELAPDVKNSSSFEQTKSQVLTSFKEIGLRLMDPN